MRVSDVERIKIQTKNKVVFFKIQVKVKSQIYLSSSSAMDFAWSDTNISWVLLRDLKTRVWTECFWTSCDEKIHVAFISIY